jgi:nitrite reductase/ring-hydroxylating ferredoxin subunit
MAMARTAKTNEITPGTIREFQLEGKAIAVANVGGKFYAINNTCLHRQSEPEPDGWGGLLPGGSQGRRHFC